jgi:5-methyltetrahydrofolate--homocysteine methyltransferase
LSIPPLDKPLVYNGSKGTLLSSALSKVGKAPSDVSEWLNLLAPDIVLRCHREYIDAGAQVIQTNSFNGNRLRLAKYGLADKVKEVNVRAAQIAGEAAGNSVAVAGSLGPSGKLLITEEVSAAEIREAFAEQAQALEEGGVDLFHIETMADIDEALAAVEGIRSVSHLPIALTLSFDTGTPQAGLRTMMGVSPAQLVEKGDELGLFAVGDNCGRGFEGYQAVVEGFVAASPRAALIMKVNAGAPRVEDGETIYDATPEQVAEYALWCAQRGVKLIGLCCGGTPRHIEAIANALAKAG